MPDVLVLTDNSIVPEQILTFENGTIIFRKGYFPKWVQDLIEVDGLTTKPPELNNIDDVKQKYRAIQVRKNDE